MYNFFVEPEKIRNNKIAITGKDYNHIVNVLRMKQGEKFFVCNQETGESFLTELEEITKNEVICKVISKNESNESNVNITLFQGIPKSDKMELIIKKSVELGVKAIVPLQMKNCIGRIKNEDKKLTRWNLISESVAKQSKRNIIPKVKNQINEKELLEDLKSFDLVLIAYENENKTSLKKVLKENKEAKNIAIIVGPEGGITEEEVSMLEKAGAKSCSLGKRILRCETAPIAMISMIIYEYEL